MGKGSGARPFSVSKEQFGNNFDAIFRKKNRNENAETTTGTTERTPENDSGSGEPTSTDSTQSRGATQDDNESPTATN